MEEGSFRGMCIGHCDSIVCWKVCIVCWKVYNVPVAAIVCLQRDWKRETIDSTGNQTPPNHRERYLPSRDKSRWKRPKIDQLLPPLDLLTFDPSVLLLAAVVKDFKGGGKEGGCFPTMHSELRRDLHLYYLPPFPSLPLPSLPPSFPLPLGQAYLNFASYISIEMQNKRRYH